MGSPSNSSPISGSSLRRCLSCLRPPCRCHKTLLKLTKQRVKSWCNYTSMNELVPSFLTKSPKLKLVLRNAISTTISLDLMVMQTLATLQVAARSGASRGHEPRRYRLRCSVRKSPSAVSRGPDRRSKSASAGTSFPLGPSSWESFRRRNDSGCSTTCM